MSKRKPESEAAAPEKASKKLKNGNEPPIEVSDADQKRLRKEEKRRKKAEKAAAGQKNEIVADEQTVEAATDKAAKRKAKEEKKARKAAKAAAKAKATESDSDSSSETAEKKSNKSIAPPSKALAATSLDTADDGARDASEYTPHTNLSGLPQKEIDEYLSKHDIKYVDSITTKTNLRPITKFEYLRKDESAKSDVFKTFSAPTPVQASTWPYMFSGRDVIGVAETGSGKTLAFGVPCIQRIAARPKNQRKGTQAVIVSPTRELACQIFDQLVLVAAPLGINVCCIYGGVPKDDQRMQLKKAHIVVATPGRLNDFLQEGAADLSNAEFACLDEADRMLDRGFEDDIRKILSATAPASRRQTVMFTATWPPSVRDLASTFMKSPVQIYIGSNVKGELQANMKIEQIVEVMTPQDKDQRLYQILREYQKKGKTDRVLIFCLYKKEATRVENNIRYKGFNVAGIHGDLSQQQRTASLDAFKSGKVPYLVATDVAARGLDIPSVKLVLNMTFPLTAEDYVHRIGRFVIPTP
jgi:ATP-dependent RNA helicase DBP3